MTDVADAPRYRSIKEVQALRITSTSGRFSSLHPVTLHFDGFPSILAEAAMVARYFPIPGDYLVIYADGYQAISPRKAFEEGYVPLASVPAPPAECAGVQALLNRMRDLPDDGLGLCWGLQLTMPEWREVEAALTHRADGEAVQAILAEWTPELEAERMRACHLLVDLGTSTGNLAEQGLTILADIVARAAAAPAAPGHWQDGGHVG